MISRRAFIAGLLASTAVPSTPYRTKSATALAGRTTTGHVGMFIGDGSGWHPVLPPADELVPNQFYTLIWEPDGELWRVTSSRLTPWPEIELELPEVEAGDLVVASVEEFELDVD